MVWWHDMKRNENGEYDGVIYTLIRWITCVFWHRHPKQITGSWEGNIGFYRATRCERCGAFTDWLE